MTDDMETKPELTDLSDSRYLRKPTSAEDSLFDRGVSIHNDRGLCDGFIPRGFPYSHVDGRSDLLDKRVLSESTSNLSLALSSVSHQHGMFPMMQVGSSETVTHRSPTYYTTDEQQNRPKFRRWRHKEYQCDDCDRMFTLKHNLQNHYMLYHMGCKTIHKPCLSCKCNECGKIYSSPSILADHQKDVHGLHTKLETCSVCLESFVTPSALSRHIKQEHVRQSKRCPFEECESKVFRYLKDVNDHIRVFHSPKSSQEKDLNCSVCDMSFKRISAKVKHEQTHMAAKLNRGWNASDEYVPAYLASSSNQNPSKGFPVRKVGRPPKNSNRLDQTNQPSTSKPNPKPQKEFHPELEAVLIKRKVATKICRNDILAKIK